MPPKVVVRSLNRRATVGRLRCANFEFQCGLGRSGMTYSKREGDGATPVGIWRITAVYFRPDRQGRIVGKGWRGRARRLRRDDGWCDAVGDRNYNRRVRHPYAGSAEHLWRDDHLYDVIVVLDHNHCPRVQGRGSAIFLHVARQRAHGGIAPTAGCISLKPRDLAKIRDHFRIGMPVYVIA